MRKTLSVLLAVMLLLAGAAAARAEGSSIEIEARRVEVANRSETLICTPVGSDYDYLMRPDGSRITTEEYTSINSVSDYDLFKVEVASVDGIHRLGLIDGEGRVLVPTGYADIEVVSDRWAYGVKLVESNPDEKDYTFSNYFSGEKWYGRIDTADFYFNGTLVGTLGRSDFNNRARAYGNYISVRNQENNWVFYNSSMAAAPAAQDGYSEYSRIYNSAEGKYEYIHNGSGQQAFVPSCTLTADEVEQSIIYENGKFINLQGEEAITAVREYDYISGRGDYAITNLNGKQGLMDFTGRELIPPEYDSLSDYEPNILEYGVICAVKDGKFGYLDAEGNVTCDFTYAESAVDAGSALSTVKNLDGTTIVLSGLAGELPEHYYEVDTRNHSRAFIAKNSEGLYSLIDMSGETLVPYVNNWIDYNLQATVASYYAGDNKFRICTFTHDDRPAAETEAPAAETGTAAPAEETAAPEAAGDGAWTCSNGHSGNTGAFCPECGEARPAENASGDVTCPACGTVYAAGEVPNFCPQDGTKLK